jgi:hypothetical protein
VRAHLGNYQVGELRFFIELDTGGAPNEEINIWLDNEIIRSVKETTHQKHIKNICKQYAKAVAVDHVEEED